MIIRDEQIQAIYRARLDISLRSLALHYRATAPYFVSELDDATLFAKLERGIERARIYDIVEGDALLQFLAFWLVVTENFDQEPSINRFLRHPGLDPAVKMSTLSDQMVEQLNAKSRALATA